MAAYGAGDQLATNVEGASHNLPNFVGELFSLSPKETPLLSLIGGLTGGKSDTSPLFTWQDTLHRAPAIPAVAEGADANFQVQKRNVRSNVVAIAQYGVEITYTKSAATGILGTTGATPSITSPSVLGTQPVMDEMAWQLQIKIEQAALDQEVHFLNGTLAYPAAGAARQTQGIMGWVAAATTTDYTATPGTEATSAVVNDLAQKLYLEGAPMNNTVLMMGARCKVELGESYSQSSTGTWNLAPRDRSTFGIDIQDVVTEFGSFGIVLNRHLDVDDILMADLSYLAPHFMAIPGKGHFFLEPLAKSGSYDRMQLYGEIGLELGPAGWHAKAVDLHT